MALLKIEIPIIVYNENDSLGVQAYFQDFDFTYPIMGEKVKFSFKSDSFQEQSDYGRLEYKTMLYLLANIDGTADVEHNCFRTGKFYTFSFVDKEGVTQNEILEHGCALDELILYDIKDCIFGFVMAMALGNPIIDARGVGIKVYFDDVLAHREVLLQYNVHNQAAKKFPELFQEKIPLPQAWKWINKNTSIGRVREKSPMYFSALSYILARDYHEAVIYAMIGLENLFASKKEKGIKERLKTRIPLLLPSICAQQIHDLYKVRSDVVHGNLQLGICLSLQEALDNDDIFENNAILATAILVASVRKLIINHSIALSFTSDNKSFSFMG